MTANYVRISINGIRQLEHIVIAEKAIGRKLKKGEEVHHVDGNGTNNSNNNLVVCPNHAYHFLLHIRQRALDATGDANKRKCKYCKEWDSLLAITITGRNAYHRECRDSSHVDWCKKNGKRIRNPIKVKEWNARYKEKKKAAKIAALTTNQ